MYNLRLYFCIQAARTDKAAHMERLYLYAGSSKVCNKYQNVRDFADLVNITGHNSYLIIIFVNINENIRKERKLWKN